MGRPIFDFELDPAKARPNVRKHGVGFQQAAAVFLDPFASTIPGEAYLETEARWVTLGLDATGGHVLVVHTFEELSGNRARVRLISARRPTKMEIRDYQENL